MPTTIGGFPPMLPQVAERPGQQPAAIAPFIESLGTNVATLEVKVGQGRLLTLRENLAVAGQPAPSIAVGDPGVIDFFIVGPRQLRLVGKRVGVTDLSITTSAGKTYSFDVQVVADLDVLRARLKQVFPDASLRLAQIREAIVIEGQARDASQVARIMETVRGYVAALPRIQVGGQVADAVSVVAPPAPAPAGPGDNVPPAPAPGPGGAAAPAAQPLNPPATAGTVGAATAAGGGGGGGGGGGPLQVINLIRVPTTQQVLLKVRVAELNRTSFRQIGADLIGAAPEFGAIFGTRIGGANIGANAVIAGRGATGAARGFTASATTGLGSNSTAFGIFQNANFEAIFSALRRNQILKVLAEPNLVAMDGHQANFLAGGEFPISVPQAGSGGIGTTVTVQFKPFGVRLDFLPIILDGEHIRLTVDPEVSQVDFSNAVTLVAGGSPVPGLITRRSHTTVELSEGQTLAIAGLLQLTLDGSTQRIPGLGDLPILGPFFSNTTSQRQEKELVVLVTPYLIEPMVPGQVPPGPGDEVKQPNDLEFYFLNRIEGRTGVDARATTLYDDPLHIVRHALLERKYLAGPCGYSK